MLFFLATLSLFLQFLEHSLISKAMYFLLYVKIRRYYSPVVKIKYRKIYIKDEVYRT